MLRFPSDFARAASWMLGLLLFALTACFASFLPTVAAGETIRVNWNWVPALGVKLSFALDGLGLLFALLISGIGALVLIYTGGYLGRHPNLGRFLVYLMLFVASMLGLVLADNLLLL